MPLSLGTYVRVWCVCGFSAHAFFAAVQRVCLNWVLRLSLSCVYAACLGLEEPQLAIAIASGPGMLVHVLYLAHPSSPG